MGRAGRGGAEQETRAGLEVQPIAADRRHTSARDDLLPTAASSRCGVRSGRGRVAELAEQGGGEGRRWSRKWSPSARPVSPLLPNMANL